MGRVRRISLRLGRICLVLLIATVGACSSSEDGDAGEIRMLDNRFEPQTFEVAAGEPVRFVNAGAVPHNAIAEDGSWSTEDSYGDLLMPADTETELVVDEPGRYPFYCSLHATQSSDGTWQGMVGTLVVGGGSNETSSSASADSRAPSEWSGDTVFVPDDYETIQSGVDAAEPGDLVLVGPGVYRESVLITTPGLVVRGTDRNEVILDGELTRTNGIHVTADGVAIENMTARNYTVNGFFWDGVTGYRGSYLTAIDDWVYGIYAFDSVDGAFEHSYASGSYDAGFYIGQCDPCDAVVRKVLAEFNGLGYSGTNSSGNIWIVDSEWRRNVAGIVPNTLDSELLPPAHDVVIAGNLIQDNGETEGAPSKVSEWSAYGNGIVLAGVRDSLVRDNTIVNNATSGVQVVSMLDENLWFSGGNVIRDNVIRGSGRSDLALGGPYEQGSCFADNDASSSVPLTLGLFHDCDGLNLPLPWGMATSSDALGRIAQANKEQNPQLAHGEAPDPALTFDQLPGGADAEVRPAVDVFASLDFDPESITAPELPDVAFDPPRPTVLGVALDGGLWPVLMGALLWWIPWAVWVIGGLWAAVIVWRSSRSVAAKVAWTLVLALLPVLGVVLSIVVGHPSRSGRKRWRAGPRLGLGIGGLVVWLGVVVAALVAGGIV